MHRTKGNSDFELARGLAEAIGLADRPPLPAPPPPFIANSLPRREHIRRPNTGDFAQVGRQLNTQRVRQRQQSLREQERGERERLTRKNAVKDVFIDLQRVEDNPLVLARTKEIISRNDASRACRVELQRERLRKISSDKSRRSRILGEMLSEEKGQWLGEESRQWEGRPLGANFFFQPKLFLQRGRKRREEGTEKLAASFELSRFSLVKRQDGMELHAQERRTQTAQAGRVRMRFREDKVEMLYPCPSGSASLFSDCL